MVKKLKKLVIIDSNALLHRAWHAIPPLTIKDGTMVNAVFGYTSLLLNIVKELQPEYIIATFDLPGKTFRHEEYKEYKATRVKQADEFYDQFPLSKDVLAAFNIPIMTKAGFEADDVLGTISVEAYKKYNNLEIIIITGDLDTLQLVNDRIKVLTLKRGFHDTFTYDEAAVKERYGLKPTQLIDLKAIQGDASDNIKGIKGLGAKGATDLIKEFGSLDNIYKKLDQGKVSHLKERTVKLLKEQKKEAYESQHLVTIVTDVPLKWRLEDAKFSEFNSEEVYKIFQKLEFHSLINKIPNHKVETKIDHNEFIKNKDCNYTTIKDISGLADFYHNLKAQKIFAFDTETTGLDVLKEKIIGISFSWQSKSACYIDLRNEKFSKIALDKLKDILENDSIAKVGHNLKFDYKVLRVAGIHLKGIYFDTLLAAYLINYNRGLKLEELSFSYISYKKLKLEDLLDEKPKKKDTIDVLGINQDRLAWYGAEDADITFRLYEKIYSLLKDNKNLELLQKIEIPLLSALADTELYGISLDNKFLAKMEITLKKDLLSLTKKIHKEAGSEFNIASPAQLKTILFEKLKISTQGIKKTKTGISTAAPELEKLKNIHPIIPLIVEYRELSKLQSTYVTALPELVNKKTKRIHTSFNQTVTATGRLSSSNPNLQNIPIRTSLGKKIRQAFIAPKNYVLLSADYSQIELRLVASISNDPKMIATFKKGEDIHASTAAEIHKIPLKEVTKEIRRTAKEVNFGILYGLGSLGLSQRTDMNRNEAKEFIESYFDIYKKMKQYLDYTKDFAHKHGYSQTIFGRRRYLPDINSSMPMLRSAAERMAINMPIQGTAADLIKIAMIHLHRDLPKVSKNSKIVLQVHDELVLEVPKEDLKKVAKFVKTTMESVHKLSVPLTVDIEVGNNWGELKSYKI